MINFTKTTTAHLSGAQVIPQAQVADINKDFINTTKKLPHLKLKCELQLAHYHSFFHISREYQEYFYARGETYKHKQRRELYRLKFEAYFPFESVENLKTKRNNKKTKARKKKGCFYL